MSFAENWIITIVAACIVSSTATALSGSGPLKEIAKIASAFVIIIAVISPLAKMDIGYEFKSRLDSNANELTQNAINKADRENVKIKDNIFSGQIAGYIEKKAKEMGIDIKAKVKLGKSEENGMYVSSVEVNYKGNATSDQIRRVSRMIKEDCGVSEEEQKHKGGQ